MSTILWAINSKCSYKCKYCYLSFSEDINPVNNEKTQGLKDLSLEDIKRFIKAFPSLGITRVFLAGAEPLSYPHKLFQIIHELKKQGVQVVLCTSGYALENYYEQIIDSDIDAVSISLDSYAKTYNDMYRQYPSDDGFEKVVAGIKLLVEKKKKRNSNIQIGIYTVLTKQNLADLEKTFLFVSNLGVDYFVYQPIFLAPEHDLFDRLALDNTQLEQLLAEINKIKSHNLSTKLPNNTYVELLLQLIGGESVRITDCFAGDELFFITPEGHIHGCPAGIMIQKESKVISVTDNSEVFVNKSLKQRYCEYCSTDCVNMWQLMDFDNILC